MCVVLYFQGFRIGIPIYLHVYLILAMKCTIIFMLRGLYAANIALCYAARLD